MRIVFIETNRITNEIIRAVAGAAPNCVGYPDGVPETWRDVAPVKQGGDLMPDLPMKHFTDETRARIAALEHEAAQMCPACGSAGGAGGGLAFPDHELDPAALLGPVDGHVFGLWGDGSGPVGGARHRAWLRWLSRFTGPADRRPMTYADLPPGDMVQLGNDLFRAYLASRADDEPADWPDERGDDEC